MHLDNLPQGASLTADEVYSPLSNGLHRLHLNAHLEVGTWANLSADMLVRKPVCMGGGEAKEVVG